jgi:hypothetical protein
MRAVKDQAEQPAMRESYRLRLRAVDDALELVGHKAGQDVDAHGVVTLAHYLLHGTALHYPVVGVAAPGPTS